MNEAPARALSKFEARLIIIVRAAVRQAPLEPALPFVMEKQSPPIGLSRDCIDLICDSLANGCVRYLAKVGGWRRERFLHGDKPMEGRVWERTTLAERKLVFSRHAVEFLSWVTAETPRDAKPWQPVDDELTIADQLLFFLTYDTFRDSAASSAWVARPIFARNPFCRLVWPEDFSAAHAPNFAGCDAGLGASILEVLQSLLAERWLAVERDKSAIKDWKSMRQLAEAQDRVLEQYLPAIEAKRRDLARFLISAASRFCESGPNADDFTSGLATDRAVRLAERIAIQKRAAVLARTLVLLSDWERQARTVGYLDDGYAATQFFLSEWDAAGADRALISARKLLRQMEPLAAGGVTS